jgi:glycosyltransferase involved in cell wall biosynthesis
MPQNTKLGIVISTYQRPDGKSPELLARALECVLNQSYSNWKIFLIGDYYKDNNEFNKLSSLIPEKQILSLNLPIAPERSRYPQGGINLWHSGGSTATTIGIELAVSMGYDYICHLDHDEIWENNHLEAIAKGIEDTKSLFLYTKGIHYDGRELPTINSKELYIKQRAQPANAIKSATCINYRAIPLRRRDPLYFYNEKDAGDAAFLKRVNLLLETSQKDSILINKVTVIHDQEGYTKTLNKEQVEKTTSNS